MFKILFFLLFVSGTVVTENRILFVQEPEMHVHKAGNETLVFSTYLLVQLKHSLTNSKIMVFK